MFTQQRWKQSQLHDLHVWGCPVYVLDKRIADGMKIPKWAPRSNRFIYMGVSSKHATTVPLLLNPDSGVISPQFHVVFDDWFTTIGASNEQLPDFNSEQWNKMFGDTEYQYVIVGDDEDSDDIGMDLQDDGWMKVSTRKDRVEGAMQHASPPVSLPVSDLPHKSPPEDQKRLSTPTQPDVTEPSLSTEDWDMVEDHPIPLGSLDKLSSPEPVQQREHPVLPIPTPSAPVPVSSDDGSSSETQNLPTEVAPQRTRSMSRVTEQALRRSNRTRAPPNRLNLLCELSDPADCFLTEHPSLEYGRANIPPTLSYMTDALLSTTPPVVCASTVVSSDAFKASIGDPDTLSYDEAMADKEHVDEWRAAARKEIETLENHGTWEVNTIDQATSRVLPGTWVFKTKRSPDGTIVKRKARYCVRGDLQEGDKDTFAPVVAWSTVRLFLILSMILKWETETIDFSSAFVQARLKVPVWIHLPRGFHTTEVGRTCLKLKKSLYGLAEAPRLWFLHLFDALVHKLGFTQSKLDPCLLLKPGMMMIVFVDDCGISYKNKSEFTKLLKDLRDLGFELTEEGSFTKFLGIKFHRTDTTITMSQQGLIDRIVETTGMNDCNPNWTPTTQESLGHDPDGIAMTDSWNYRSVIGMLLYLSTNTRPDIAFAVSQAARFSNNPKQSHATAVKTIVRYLFRTRDQGTIVTMTNKLDIKLYVDADFAGLYKKEKDSDPNSARSRTGYILILGGFPLIWKSHLQSEISLSTLEAEYSALSSSLRALIPIRELIFEIAEVIVLPQELVTSIICTVFEDNQGAYLLATTHRITSRTKYFIVKYHHFWIYIKMENNNKRKIWVVKVSTDRQGADFLTKGLTRVLFEKNRKLILGW
jgi:hypothetical protein